MKTPLHHHFHDGIYHGKNSPNPCARCIMEQAAPAMYDALKIALRIIEAEKEACGIYKEHTEKIRAALAAAEGK